MFWFGTKDIKFYLAKFLDEQSELFKNSTVLDFPAGNGVTSSQLHNIGARVIAMDLFPEFFRDKKIECIKADLSKDIKLADNSVDWVICQEGVEHMPNQISIFSEFNRVTKIGGKLLITTPNYSNLRSKLSYMLTESELFNRLMPPNEYDSIWHSRDSSDIYFGHINLIGIARLRLFALINGYKIIKVHGTRVNYTAFLLFILLYPLILVSSFSAYRRFKRKTKKKDADLQDLFKLMTSPTVLLCGHLMVELEKVKSAEEKMINSGIDSSNFVT